MFSSLSVKLFNSICIFVNSAIDIFVVTRYDYSVICDCLLCILVEYGMYHRNWRVLVDML